MRTLSRLSPCVCWVMASVAFSSRLPTMEHNSALLMLMYCGTAALTSIRTQMPDPIAIVDKHRVQRRMLAILHWCRLQQPVFGHLIQI